MISLSFAAELVQWITIPFKNCVVGYVVARNAFMHNFKISERNFLMKLKFDHCNPKLPAPPEYNRLGAKWLFLLHFIQYCWSSNNMNACINSLQFSLNSKEGNCLNLYSLWQTAMQGGMQYVQLAVSWHEGTKQDTPTGSHLLPTEHICSLCSIPITSLSI